ncbi:MAG: hypothetical protein J5993_00430 [Clostridia bacterium]|nr:hypothetical protein [Clostridia bacterium]
MIFYYVLLAAYLVGANVYGFFLVKNERYDQDGGNGKLFLAAILGGALAVYSSMFIFRFRLKNPFLMLTMPILIVFNVFLAILLFRAGQFAMF